MNEIAELSSKVWRPKTVENQVVKPTMVVPNLRAISPETPAEAAVFAQKARRLSQVNNEGRRQGPLTSKSPKPLLVGDLLSTDSIRAQAASLSDTVSQVQPWELSPVNAASMAQLTGVNELAHDRISAVPQEARGHILSSGLPQSTTVFLQRPRVPTSPLHNAAPNNLQLDEIFHSVQSPDGTATTLGRTLINNEWYHFGTNSGSSPLQQASTWIAPTRLLTSPNPARETDLSAQRVLQDVQGLFKGPWKPYINGSGLQTKPHTVDIRHADKDGIKSVLATINTITGTLQTIQSVTKGIQQGLELIGMLGSLGDLGKYMSIFNQMKLPGTPGELITALITGKGINPNSPPKPPRADQTGSGKNGVLVTKGGAAASAIGDGMLAKAEAEKKKAEEAAAKKKAEEEAAKKKADEEAAKKQAEEEAAKKKAGEEAAKKQAEEEAAKKKTDEEAAKKQAEEEAAKKKTDEEAAKKQAEEDAAKKKADEEAAKKQAEEEAGKKKQADEEAAKKKADDIALYTKADGESKDGHGKVELGAGVAKTGEGVIKGENGGFVGQASVDTAEAKAEGGFGYGAGGKGKVEVSKGEIQGGGYLGSDPNNPVAEVQVGASGPKASAQGDILVGDDGKRVGLALGGKAEAQVGEVKGTGEVCIDIPFTDKNVCVGGEGSVAPPGTLGGGAGGHIYYDKEEGRGHLGGFGEVKPIIVGVGVKVDISVGNKNENRDRPYK